MLFLKIKKQKSTLKLVTSLLSIFACSAVSAQTYNLQKMNTEFSIDGNHGARQRQQVYLWGTNDNNVNQQWNEINRGGGFYSYLFGRVAQQTKINIGVKYQLLIIVFA